MPKERAKPHIVPCDAMAGPMWDCGYGEAGRFWGYQQADCDSSNSLPTK